MSLAEKIAQTGRGLIRSEARRQALADDPTMERAERLQEEVVSIARRTGVFGGEVLNEVWSGKRDADVDLGRRMQ